MTAYRLDVRIEQRPNEASDDDIIDVASVLAHSLGETRHHYMSPEAALRLAARIGAVARVAALTADAAPPTPAHAAKLLEIDDQGRHFGLCRCGWETAPYVTANGARAALTRHLLDPEG